MCRQSARTVQEGGEHNDRCAELWAFEEKKAFCSLCLQTLFVGVFFYFYDVFYKFAIEIVTSGSLETAFLKMVQELLIANTLQTGIFFFSLAIFFFISISFQLYTEIFKPAMFLQTNNVFSSTSPTFQFISRFNSKVLS